MIFKFRFGVIPEFEDLLGQALAHDAYCDRGWVHAGLANLLVSRGIKAHAKIICPDEIMQSLEQSALFIASVSLKLPATGGTRGGHLVLLHGVRRVRHWIRVLLCDPSRWGEHLTEICADRLFHTYSGRGILVSPRPSTRV